MWSPPDWVATIERAEHSEAKRDAPFEPDRVRAAGQQVEVAQDRRPAVLGIQELVHEQVHRRAERVQRKVAHVLREREQRKRRAEREVRERRLQTPLAH